MHRKSGLALIALTLCLLLPQHASADTKSELEETREAFEKIDEQAQEIAQRKDTLEKELANLKELLVSLAEDIKSTRTSLENTKAQLEITTEEIKQRNASLEKEQVRLTALVTASLSLSHTPPEAMIMMPGDVTEKMKTARALKMSSDAVKQITGRIAQELTALKELKETAIANEKLLEQQQATLEAKQTQLSETQKARKEAFVELNAEHEKISQTRSKLARRMQDLEALVEAIEEERATRKLEDAKRTSRGSFTQNKGKVNPPASGQILAAYGSKRGKSPAHRGVTLKTKPNALVITPISGEVIFTGPFLKFGDMVIIHHEGGFHTLLAGLEQIDVQNGEFLLEGEPIGAMGKGEKEQTLYIELRKNNQPVNPAQWMRGLE